MELLSGYVAIDGYFFKEFFFDFVRVNVHKLMTLLFPIGNVDLFLVWVQIENMRLQFTERSMVHLSLDKLAEQSESRFWKVLSVDDRSQVVNGNLIFGGDLSLLSVSLAFNFLFVVGHIVDYTFWDGVMSVMVEGLSEIVILLSFPWHR